MTATSALLLSFTGGAADAGQDRRERIALEFDEPDRAQGLLSLSDTQGDGLVTVHTEYVDGILDQGVVAWAASALAAGPIDSDQGVVNLDVLYGDAKNAPCADTQRDTLANVDLDPVWAVAFPGAGASACQTTGKPGAAGPVLTRPGKAKGGKAKGGPAAGKPGRPKAGPALTKAKPKGKKAGPASMTRKGKKGPGGYAGSFTLNSGSKYKFVLKCWKASKRPGDLRCSKATKRRPGIRCWRVTKRPYALQVRRVFTGRCRI